MAKRVFRTELRGMPGIEVPILSAEMGANRIKVFQEQPDAYFR